MRILFSGFFNKNLLGPPRVRRQAGGGSHGQIAFVCPQCIMRTQVLIEDLRILNSKVLLKLLSELTGK